jgi:hypothetical protein
MALNQVRGWFADRREDDGRWSPYLQNDFSGITGLDITFDDRDACEWFIRQHLVGQGWLDGPRRYQCPDCLAEPEKWCTVLATGENRLTYHAERNRYTHGGWPG